MNNKAPNKHSDARSFEMRRLIFLGAAGVLILVVVILSLLSAFGGKSDGQSTGNGTSSAVTEDGKLVIQDLYEGEITIPKFNVPLNTYDQSKFKNDNGLVTYDDANANLGIDVSDYQGDIDWAAVKASGIDFAMIRAGYRGATRGKLNEDSKFADNYTGAKDAGVKVGIYFFSQATSVTEAEEEAGYVLQLLQNKSVDYPVVFDWEQTSVDGSRTADATGEQITSYASAFCKKIAKAGYTAGVYFNRSLGYNYYDTAACRHSTIISACGSIPTTRRCRASTRQSILTSALRTTADFKSKNERCLIILVRHLFCYSSSSPNQPQAFMSTRPSGRNCTPSASSFSRCTSGPPKT